MRLPEVLKNTISRHVEEREMGEREVNIVNLYDHKYTGGTLRSFQYVR